MEDYQVNVPGYAGFKPKYALNTNQLRESCFEYKPKWLFFFIIPKKNVDQTLVLHENIFLQSSEKSKT